MTITFGTVSHGTLRNEDLLEAFANELETICKSEAVVMADPETSRDRFNHWAEAQKIRDQLIEAARTIDPESENASKIVYNLIGTLDEYAPPYSYFGAHEGDGSDFGFWPSMDSLEDAVRNGEVLKLEAGAEIPEDYQGEVMFVTDHGNVTLGYTTDAGFVESWAVV